MLACSVRNSTLTSPAGEIKLFKIGYLFDSERGIWLRDQSLLISEDVIIDVNPRILPTDTVVYDFSASFVIPGLIDAHTHLFLEDPTYGKDFSRGLLEFTRTHSEDQRIEIGLARARSLLKNGFTSVRDLGNQGEIRVDKLKEERDLSDMARFHTSGKGLTPHGGQFPPGTDRKVIIREYTLMLADPEEFFQQHLRSHVDLMKLYADEEPNPSFATLERLREWVNYAHEKGLKVAVHGILPKGIDLAIRSGADSLEHGTYITKVQLKEMTKSEMIFVPSYAESLFLLPATRSLKQPETEEMARRICRNIKEATQTGVKLAFGSDNYFSLQEFGIEFGEANLLILKQFQLCGLSPEQAIQAATFHAAVSMGKEKRLGVLQKGALADFIILNRKPVSGLEVLFQPQAVYLGGKRIR